MNDALNDDIPEAAQATGLEVVPEPAQAPSEGRAEGGASERPADAAAPPSLPEELSALQRERDGLKEQLVRRRADFENLKRRAEREQAQARADGIADIVSALIPSLDNLDRALGAEGDPAAFREGIALIRRALQAALEGQGVRSEDPTGSPFDPNQHQAVAHDPHPDAEDGAVVEALGKAYFLDDRLIRPAFVRVARRETTPSEGAAEEIS
jgi:molecular chaperone GrpE